MLAKRAFKEDKLTWQERWNNILEGKKIDRVPMHHFIPGFCAQNVGIPIADMYQNPVTSYMAQLQTIEQYGFDGGPDYGYASYGGWEFGGEIKFPKGEYEQAPSHARFAVQNEDDVFKLALPDVKNAGSVPFAMQFSHLQAKYNTPISVVLSGCFTMGGNICPVNTFCRWTLKKPELAHHILKLASEFSVKVVKYWADTFGPENVIPNIWEPLSSNEIISPKQFETFALPYIKKTSEKILDLGVKHILYHICGEQNKNLPYWTAVPTGKPGLISVGHQIDLATAIEHFGKKNIIIGNIETSVIQNGPSSQVYDLCRNAIQKAKAAPRGYMLMSGCELPPNSPPNNVYAMRKAIDNFGWYD